MNGKLLISLFAGLLLAGGAGWAEGADCEKIKEKDKNKECQGDRDYPIVTINTESEKIAPEFVCAAHGSVIEFRVVPPGKTDSGAVDVKAKDPSNAWLTRANFPDPKKIEVRVPRWIEKKSVHGYNIYFKGGKCIDPRIHVEP